MAEPIRYGIIGTGMMGCEHIRNILARDDAVVTAISDPNEASRRWGQLALSEGAGESAAVAAFDGAVRDVVVNRETALLRPVRVSEMSPLFVLE